jgi:hypothetical protein
MMHQNLESIFSRDWNKLQSLRFNVDQRLLWGMKKNIYMSETGSFDYSSISVCTCNIKLQRAATFKDVNN